MARTPTLTFDRGTLILHPPPRGKGWMDYATWDDRVEKFRIPAVKYRALVETLQAENTNFLDEAKAFFSLELTSSMQMEPYPHQTEALGAWKLAGRQGVVVLPTAAGKTYLAQMAMEVTPRTTLIVVPTLDLMHQWYAHLVAAFPDAEVGLLGGGSRDKTPILVATYDSAAINAETLGNQYALIIFDECHHLPTDFNRVIAEYAIAPYRLGLSATPERSDGKHADLNILIGPEVYRKRAEELAGKALAEHEVVQIKVKLSQHERQKYNQLIQIRNDFLQQAKISLGSIQGWQKFVQMSARSQSGRRAMLAHREAKEIALGTDGKLRILANLLAKHYPERVLIFTADNATVYRISSEFLIPAITHQTPVKERHEILTKFREGEYKTLIASHVLNEGVDVPAASVAIILSGTGSAREYIQRLGRVLRKGKDNNKQAILYEVVAEDTAEEGTSARRRGIKNNEPQRRREREEKKEKRGNLQVVYGSNPQKSYRAAEQLEFNYFTENKKAQNKDELEE
ncbi:DEAD/DEAH box helicase family protein [Chlorogloeopsis fritschii PCC 9212]|uniref:DNA 3'-5' helicase n=1 Tax=Chlorogloeopsis fritschii PCC 6912 TaxID=211165 RepID=A0A3S0XLN2_CHLFR|nr:DEAD/DEAH box helicase family protein [Chlorogloeopsis fritschii]MBF2006782.1 DEAD/DEAH box helicase family protein [Chlorogloeopsis fritschii C42_A2020_084]RUR75556.1 helicase [Chlorogloeopsis fritschii PCC 6912]